MFIAPPAHNGHAPAGRNGRCFRLVTANGLIAGRPFRPAGACSLRDSLNYKHCVPTGLTLAVYVAPMVRPSHPKLAVELARSLTFPDMILEDHLGDIIELARAGQWAGCATLETTGMSQRHSCRLRRSGGARACDVSRYRRRIYNPSVMIHRTTSSRSSFMVVACTNMRT